MKATIPALLGFLLLATPGAVQAQFGCTTNADNTLTITNYTGSGGVVTIPTNINGLTVTGIGASAFAVNFNLISITIPVTVTSLGDYAFGYCLGLAGVTIPGSLTNIGDGAFFDCTRLASITIVGPLTIIGTNMFADCTSLAGVTIPNSVTNIGDGAFFDCSSLTNFAIPASVTRIGDGVFSDCAGLSAITVDPQNPAYVGVNGVLFDKSQATLIQYPSGLSGGYSIPGTVTRIEADAFAYCPGLNSVTIADTVTGLGDGAFFYCGGLTTIYFNGNPPAADSSVFTGDNNATAYYLPSMTGWSSTFAGIPAVPWWPGLLSFTTNAGAITITGYSGSGGAVTIPTHINGLPVTSIGDNAFSDTAVTIVNIPNNVTSIGDLAFYGCSNLNSITIPSGVTSIGPFAFSGCASLASITIPDNVNALGDATFYGCASLTNITIGAAVTSIGDLAFFGCTSLASVTIPGGIGSVGDQAFGGCTSLNIVYFSGDAPTVGSSVFFSDNATIYYSVGTAGWSSIFAGLPAVEIPYNFTVNSDETLTINGYAGPAVSLSIPATIIGLPVTGIGDYAFYETGLAAVTIPNSVTSIGEGAFLNCHSLGIVTLGASVASIGGDAFDGTILTNVTIPASVTNIEEGAFADCSSLTAITVDAHNPVFSSSYGVLFNKAQTTLVIYPGGQIGGYTIPSGVTNIANYAFGGCLGLNSVMIPGSILSITDNVFYGCANLMNITISEGVTSFGSDTFGACSSLGSVTIPDSVTNLGGAFDGCSGLTNVILGSGVTSIGGYAFAGCRFTSITIPGGVTNIGIEAFGSNPSLMAVYFKGNPPILGPYVFDDPNTVTLYYLARASAWTTFYSEDAPVVLWNPFIRTGDGNFGVRSNQFGFNIAGTNNFTVVVEACTNLAQPVWIPLQTITLTNGVFYFSDSQWTNFPNRFYGLGLP